MPRRILVLDVAGCDTALATSSRGVAQWASTVSSVLAKGSIPPGMALSIDPATGESDAGGLSLRTTDISSLLADVGASAATDLNGDLSASATSVTVTDASGLPSSGKIWVGQECISYLSITTNTLNSCTRAALGTYALPHYDTDLVYTSNPAILGRRVELSWQDARVPSTSTAWTRWVGFLDSISWDDGYYTLRIISASKLATDEKVLATSYVKGKLARDFPASVDLYLDHDGDDTWTVYSSTRGYTHVLIDDEIIKVGQVIRPANSAVINSYTSPDQLFVDFPTVFEVGQKLDLTNSAGTVQVQGVTVTKIYDAASASSYVNVAGIPSTYSYTSGDKLLANYTTAVPKGRLTRGAYDTPKQDHEAGAEVSELRIFDGDAIEDVLLPLMCSVDGSGTHGPGGGAYDILPVGWGASIDTSFIDLSSLQEISKAGRSGNRRYVWQESVSLKDLLRWAAQTCNASLFWSEAGQLTATLREDIYPSTTTSATLDGSVRRQGTIPSAEIRTDRLYNAAEIKMDYDPVSGEPHHTLIVEIDESVQRYGRRHIEISDPGLRKNESDSSLQTTMTGWLRWRAAPYPEVTLSVILSESTTYRPGDLVTVSIPHLPDMSGGKGLAGTWEIIEVSPSDAQGQIDLSLIYRGDLPRVGLIAPSGIAASVDAGAKEITLVAASTTQMAQSSAYSPTIPVHDGDGTEDSDWFEVGDLLTLWDVSSFGSGSVNTHNCEITNINFASRIITVDAFPGGWTLAANDIVRLREWAGFASASTVADRQDVFIALADSTASPPDLGSGDSAYVWGM